MRVGLPLALAACVALVTAAAPLLAQSPTFTPTISRTPTDTPTTPPDTATPTPTITCEAPPPTPTIEILPSPTTRAVVFDAAPAFNTPANTSTPTVTDTPTITATSTPTLSRTPTATFAPGDTLIVSEPESWVYDRVSCKGPEELAVAGRVRSVFGRCESIGGVVHDCAAMPSNYDGGPLHFALGVVVTDEPTSGDTLAVDFACQCGGSGEVIGAYGVAQSLSYDLGAAAQYERIEGETAGTTCAGTCAAGDAMCWRATVTETDMPAATLYERVKVRYGTTEPITGQDVVPSEPESWAYDGAICKGPEEFTVGGRMRSKFGYCNATGGTIHDCMPLPLDYDGGTFTFDLGVVSLSTATGDHADGLTVAFACQCGGDGDVVGATYGTARTVAFNLGDVGQNERISGVTAATTCAGTCAALDIMCWRATTTETDQPGTATLYERVRVTYGTD